MLRIGIKEHNEIYKCICGRVSLNNVLYGTKNKLQIHFHLMQDYLQSALSDGGDVPNETKLAKTIDQ